MRLRRSDRPMLLMSTPSMLMLPERASTSLKNDIISVVFPHPVLPAMPTCSTYSHACAGLPTMRGADTGGPLALPPFIFGLSGTEAACLAMLTRDSSGCQAMEVKSRMAFAFHDCINALSQEQQLACILHPTQQPDKMKCAASATCTWQVCGR